MARRVFYSFHYIPDNWRASQIRNMGVLDGNRPATDNEWEAVTGGGDAAIKRWIDGQLNGKSCALILIGSATANRKWINYEIETAWNSGKGILGVHIHNLKDAGGLQARKGENPFTYLTLSNSGRRLSAIVEAHDPPYSASSDVYSHISINLASWVETAIAIRDAN